MRNIWATRLLTFFLWLLAAASVGYWLLQTTTRSKPSPALARADLAGGAPAAINPNTLAVAYALGAVGSPPSRTAIALGNAPDGSWDIKRFRLSGIMAQGSVKDGLVVLSIDGKPAEVLRVGSRIEPNIVLQSLTRQSITLANTQDAEHVQTFILNLSGANTQTTEGQPAALPSPAQYNNQSNAEPAAAANTKGNNGAADPIVSLADRLRQSRRSAREEQREQRENGANADANSNAPAVRVAQQQQQQQPAIVIAPPPAAQAPAQPAAQPAAPAPQTQNSDDLLYFKD